VPEKDKKTKFDPAKLFERDDIDEALINADDTGMVAEQHEITEDEVILGIEGKLPENER
jgi:hypothetical protein